MPVSIPAASPEPGLSGGLAPQGAVLPCGPGGPATAAAPPRPTPGAAQGPTGSGPNGAQDSPLAPEALVEHRGR